MLYRMNITGYLFDSAVQNEADNELFGLVKRVIEYGFRGTRNGEEEFLCPLSTYLDHAPTAFKFYAEAGKSLIGELTSKHGVKIKEADLDAVTPAYASTFGALARFVVVGVDTEKEGFPSALYTRSANLLNFLVQQGMATQDDVDKVSKHLFGNKTGKAVAEGKYVAARLDFEEIKEGRPRFKLVVPTSSMDIGLQKQYAIIPVPFFYMFERVLENIAKERAFKFTKQSVDGVHTHIAAVSSQIVRDAYAGSDRELVEARIRKIRTGYDVLRRRYMAFDLESSIHAVGVTTFRPEMLNSLSPVAVADADKSRHEINFTLLRGIFKTRINQAKGDQLPTLNIMDLSGYATVADKKAAIIGHAEDNWSDAELYAAVKRNPEIFGDIDDALTKRERVQPKFLKGYQMVDLQTLGKGVSLTETDALSARAKALTSLLDKGVVKITASRKDGNLIEIVGSNNPKVLVRMLGADYVIKMENPRTKLYYLQELLRTGKLTVGADLNRLLVQANVQDLLDGEKMNPPGKPSESKRKTLALEAIQEAITALKEKAATRKPQPDYVLVRDVYATAPEDFMRTVSVNNLVAVEFSPETPSDTVDPSIAQFVKE